MMSVRALQAGFICLLCLGGCTISPHEAGLAVDVERTLPRVVLLNDTPFFPQTDYQCGPAALATVLQAQGIDIAPADLSPGVYLPGRKGSLQVEMVAAARRYRSLPYVLDASFTALLRELAAGNPVLVLQNLGLGVLPRWHYAVVVGYDLNTNNLILRSGTLKQRTTSFTVFMRTWRRSGQWALVVLPAGEIPVTADPATYLGTAHVFEETGMAEQAAIAYRAATERWPEDVRGWMMSGNMAFAEKNFDEAVTDFLTASGIAPDNPTTWNNLAYALREKGCIREAKTALQCALLISPEDRNLRDSLKEINRVVIAGRKPGYCEPVNCAQSSLYLGQRPSRE